MATRTVISSFFIEKQMTEKWANVDNYTFHSKNVSLSHWSFHLWNLKTISRSAVKWLIFVGIKFCVFLVCLQKPYKVLTTRNYPQQTDVNKKLSFIPCFNLQNNESLNNKCCEKTTHFGVLWKSPYNKIS